MVLYETLTQDCGALGLGYYHFLPPGEMSVLGYSRFSLREKCRRVFELVIAPNDGRARGGSRRIGGAGYNGMVSTVRWRKYRMHNK